MLKKFFVIWEYANDWEKWNFKFATRKDAENYLLEFWKDLDLEQADYKMDNYQIEDDYEKIQ